jgi:hypothetical protein
MLSDVSIDKLGSNAATVGMPTGERFTVVATTNPTPMSLEVVKAKGQTDTTMAVRYNDVELPANVKVLLSVGPQGVELLRSDNDNNGSFENVLTPTANLNGAAAADRSAPQISFAENSSGATATITLSTVDTGSGVKSVYYCVEGFSEAGMFCEPYTGAFQVNPDQTPIVYAFADDNAGNQSGLRSYRLLSGSRISFVSTRDGDPEI